MIFIDYVSYTRFLENHGPKLDENDLVALKSPLYQCLKEDVNSRNKQKMLNLTPYGTKRLEDKGIFLNKNGFPTEPKDNKKDVPRCKDLNFEESNRINEQKVQELGGIIKSAISNYYTKPSNFVSNRGLKESKKVFDNYISKCKEGYLKGDRVNFHNASSKIDIIENSGRRPVGEMLFKRMKRTMDSIRDKPDGPSYELW